jgi:hypothetical protein
MIVTEFRTAARTQRPSVYKQSQIELEICLPPEHSLPLVPPHNHMIKCSREMNPWFPRHNDILPKKVANQYLNT